MLTYFRLTKGRVMVFRPETIVVSFLHLMVFIYKVFLNHVPVVYFFRIFFFKFHLAVYICKSNILEQNHQCKRKNNNNKPYKTHLLFITEKTGVTTNECAGVLREQTIMPDSSKVSGEG